MLANRRAAWLLVGGGGLFLLFATLLTNSRMGILLIPLALAGAATLVFTHGRWKHGLVWLAVGLMAAAGGIAALAEVNLALGSIFSRFAEHADFRRELWRDGWFALTRSWPAGIGMGGGELALLAAERLEVVDWSAPNRVHNDYLEFVLEGGLLSILVLLGAVGLTVVTAWREWRERTADRGQIVFGFVVLALIACHSLVDYPLRSMALACLTGPSSLMQLNQAANQAQAQHIAA